MTLWHLKHTFLSQRCYTVTPPTPPCAPANPCWGGILSQYFSPTDILLERFGGKIWKRHSEGGDKWQVIHIKGLKQNRYFLPSRWSLIKTLEIPKEILTGCSNQNFVPLPDVSLPCSYFFTSHRLKVGAAMDPGIMQTVLWEICPVLRSKSWNDNRCVCLYAKGKKNTSANIDHFLRETKLNVKSQITYFCQHESAIQYLSINVISSSGWSSLCAHETVWKRDCIVVIRFRPNWSARKSPGWARDSLAYLRCILQIRLQHLRHLT